MKEKKEDLFDRLLALSPDIAEGPEDILLLPLVRTSAYWSLNTLKPIPAYSAAVGHPFLEKLGEFQRDFGLKFTLTPTAPWALWVHARHAPRELLEIWDTDSIRRALLASAPALGRPVIADLLTTGEHQSLFEFFLESCDALGVNAIETLFAIPPEALSERFGPLAIRYLKRLRGADDLDLTWYVPSLTLSRIFRPRIEKMINSDESQDLLERFQSTLQAWERRLEARKLLLRGLRLRLKSERRGKHEAFFISLPRPSRSAKNLFPILQEKWLAAVQKSFEDKGEGFDDELDEVVIESMGLEPESDTQTDLFDPHREERHEAWNTLIGRLAAKSTAKEPVRIGTWRPVESYLPEGAVEWMDWSESAVIPMIQDHPKRPPTLLREPKPLTAPRLTSEIEFLDQLQSSGALSTLERITDLWNPRNRRIERSYARLGNQWIFWDHEREGAYVHGYFEAPSQP